MRPIDADKLLKKKIELYIPPEDPEETWCFGADVVVIPVDDVEQAPTLTYEDLVPHGRWDFVDQRFYDGGFVDIYICTSCGLSNDGKSIFCPNCGAKMDLED